MIPGRFSCASGLRALTFSPRPHLLVQVGTRPSSSLSAVHRGLRQSERLDRKSYSAQRGSSVTGDGDARPPRTGRPRAGVNGDRFEKIDFKIRKGKKDIAEPPKFKPQSRSARFNDPTNSFGKNSLVYKLKSGQLRDELSALHNKDLKAAQTDEDFWRSSKRAPSSKSRSVPPGRGTARPSPSGSFWDRRGRVGSRVRGETSSAGDFRDYRPASEGARRPAMDGRGDRTRDSAGARSSGGDAPRSRDYGAPRSRDSEAPRSREADAPRRREYDTPRSRDGDAPRSRDYGAPRSRNGDAPRSREYSAPRSRDSETPRSREVDAPRRREYDAPRSPEYDGARSRDSEASRGRGNGAPRSREYDSPRRSNYDATRSREYGTPQSRDDDAPRSRKYDAPRSSGHDALRSREYDTPRSHERDAPRSQSAEGYRTKDHQRFGDDPEPIVATIKYTTAASQFLYGKFVVEEALRASRRKLYHLYIYGGANRENVGRDMAIERLAEKKGVKVTTLGEQDQKLMAKMSQGRPHNGYILEASPIPQPPVTALGPLVTEESESGGVNSNSFSIVLGHQTAEDLAINGKDTTVHARGGQHKPLVLLLDHVLDPGNLGAILRTASFLGASAVAISTKSSATLSPVALKSSAGASESIPLFAVDSPVSFLEGSKEAGWKVYAAVAAHSGSHHREHADVYSVEEGDPLASDPCILVVGSEGDGLPRMLKAKADTEISIPNQSDSLTVDSLNVSVAAALLCSAFMRGRNRLAAQRRPGGPVKSEELGIWS
ncbi:hypothetical protein RB594_001601 [Gaeumannomyces avenae]